MEEEKLTLRRRNPKNQGGRPRIEDIADPNTDMEQVAQLMRQGYTIPEIAERLAMSIEKVKRILSNPWVKARLEILYGDRLQQVAISRDRMWDAIVESIIRQAKEDKLPISQLDDILKRYDPYHRSEALTDNEKKLVKNRLELPEGSTVIGSNPAKKEKSIFDDEEDDQENEP